MDKNIYSDLAIEKETLQDLSSTDKNTALELTYIPTATEEDGLVRVYQLF